MVSSVHDSLVLVPPAPQKDEQVAALRALDLLDTAEDDIYNSIVTAAGDVCQAAITSLGFPVGEPSSTWLPCVYLAEGSRQWFRSPIGISLPRVSGDNHFCSRAIPGKESLIVSDTLRDQRFRASPLVTGPPYIRFYAGVPILNREGLVVGSLCVMDTRPRALDDRQQKALAALAQSAARVWQLRKSVGIAVFARAIDMASDGVTIAGDSPTGMTLMYANESFERLTGYSHLDAIDQPAFFPLRSDFPGLVSTLAEAARTGQMKTLDCELVRKNGEPRWTRVSFIPYVDGTGKLAYLVTVHRDISLLREAEAHMQQLYAMRTTLATIEHVVRNFLNSAQLYSSYVNARAPIKESVQQPFEKALEEARSQVEAMKRMPSFKDKPTSSGLSVLDVARKR